MVHASQQLGKRFASFSLPARKTCPGVKDCLAYCYAQTGTFNWNSVKNALVTNFQALVADGMSNDAHMFTQLWWMIYHHRKTIDVIRVHPSGDFFNLAYFTAWMNVARAFPHIQFYAYTKSLRIVKQYIDAGNSIPSNFRLIASRGGRYDELIDELGLPVCNVITSVEMYQQYAHLPWNDEEREAAFGKGSFNIALHGRFKKGTPEREAVDYFKALEKTLGGVKVC